MNKYSAGSLTNLEQCHEDLQAVFKAALKVMDHTIVCGHRGEIEQTDAFINGKTQLQWPRSKHNSVPSMAVDAAPCPIDWEDINRFHLFAGIVLGIAHEMGIAIRWGGDWDQDTQVRDNKFDDLVHFELV